MAQNVRYRNKIGLEIVTAESGATMRGRLSDWKTFLGNRLQAVLTNNPDITYRSAQSSSVMKGHIMTGTRDDGATWERFAQVIISINLAFQIPDAWSALQFRQKLDSLLSGAVADMETRFVKTGDELARAVYRDSTRQRFDKVANGYESEADF